ncbi:MAG: DUF4190 domain-containing protein [Anaerolineae bacterium]|jgi:hypothetical protein|nr:DUF4190 domain-containing protein [Anaerolineae bacterium]MBT7073596.1 DUF4190 domain-containing protein [Anaerolineae bacterium]
MTQEPYQQAPSAPPTNSMALTSLIAGIVGWTVAPFLGSLVAIITGHMAKKELKERMGQESGDGMATAGLVMGYLQLIPSILCICIVGIMFAMGVSIPILDSILNSF